MEMQAPLRPPIEEVIIVEPFIPSEERFILRGVASAIRSGDITEDAAHEWLDSYIEKRRSTTRHNG